MSSEGDKKTINNTSLDNIVEKIKMFKKKVKKEKQEQNKGLEKIKGNFDFLMPKLSSISLEKFLSDKEISPFVFHGNIDLSIECYDLIGEIKENFNEYNSKIEQTGKYMKLIEYFKTEESNDIQMKRFGFNYKRPKILMYVFDGSYSWFLKNMLDFQINQQKFVFVDKKFKASDSYQNIIETFQENKGNKSLFIQFIINSNIPFIFLYIPDIIRVKKMKDVKIQLLEKNNKEQDKKMKEQDKKMKEQDKKMKELKGELDSFKKRLFFLSLIFGCFIIWPFIKEKFLYNREI